MKAKKLITAFLVATMVFAPVMASAESLESLDQQESELLQQSQTISGDIEAALDSVNAKYQEVEALKSKISDNEATLEETKQAIEEAQESIARHKEIVANRLKSLQLNRTSENKLAILLQSASISEFVSSLYAITMLQSAEQEEINGLQEETERLQELEEKVSSTQAALQESEASLVSEADELDSQIASLQAKLSDNRSALDQIANSKAVETQRLQAEEERKAAEEAEAQKAAAEAAQAASQESTQPAASNNTNSSTNNNNSNNNASNNTTPPANNTPSAPAEQNQSSGRVLFVEATAYSFMEPGMSYFTALGIDLRQNSRVIAVDPSVIPLGSLVEVEGYGIAIAGDTGGAIVGYKIDVHFNTVEECIAWGRRFNVRVTILE